jgi:hypothetical protein
MRTARAAPFHHQWLVWWAITVHKRCLAAGGRDATVGGGPRRAADEPARRASVNRDRANDQRVGTGALCQAPKLV